MGIIINQLPPHISGIKMLINTLKKEEYFNQAQANTFSSKFAQELYSDVNIHLTHCYPSQNGYIDIGNAIIEISKGFWGQNIKKLILDVSCRIENSIKYPAERTRNIKVHSRNAAKVIKKVIKIIRKNFKDIKNIK